MTTTSTYIRTVDRQQLAEVIHVGEHHDYNRQAKWEVLDVLKPGETMQLGLAMIHRHRCMDDYEPHARCALLHDGKLMAFVDVPIDLFNRLPGGQTLTPEIVAAGVRRQVAEERTVAAVWGQGHRQGKGLDAINAAISTHLADLRQTLSSM